MELLVVLVVMGVMMGLVGFSLLGEVEMNWELHKESFLG